MAFIYEITREPGRINRSSNWEDVLTHEDVTDPGRISEIRVLSEQSPPVRIALAPDDVLVFSKRTQIALGLASTINGINGHLIIGRRTPSGAIYGYAIEPNGSAKAIRFENKTTFSLRR